VVPVRCHASPRRHRLGRAGTPCSSTGTGTATSRSVSPQGLSQSFLMALCPQDQSRRGTGRGNRQKRAIAAVIAEVQMSLGSTAGLHGLLTGLRPAGAMAAQRGMVMTVKGPRRGAAGGPQRLTDGRLRKTGSSSTRATGGHGMRAMGSAQHDPSRLPAMTASWMNVVDGMKSMMRPATSTHHLPGGLLGACRCLHTGGRPQRHRLGQLVSHIATSGTTVNATRRRRLRMAFASPRLPHPGMAAQVLAAGRTGTGVTVSLA
jgi:hypothetical protein